MNETAREDRARSSDETGAVAGLGLVVAAFATTGLAVPVREGVDHLAVLFGLLFAVGTLAVFAGRRYDLLERRYSLAGALGSLLVVLLAGYALTQGISGGTDIPGLGVRISTVFVSFLAAGTAIGIALAEYGSVPTAGLLRRTVVTARLAALALVAWIVSPLIGLLLEVPVVLVVGGLSEIQRQAVMQIGVAIGTAAIAVAFVYTTGRDRSYFDLETPSLRAVAWIAGGVALIFLVNIAISVLFSSGGIEGAEHSATQAAQRNPELLYVMVPASILITGPFEELMYRNVIQKSMYDVFSPVGALLVSSVLFTAVHTAAYATAGPEALIASLAIVFGLSLVLGTVYLVTSNLVVPAIIHGIYNAVIFASIAL
ncbi:CPBP family intramembrane glutamic endopeptidase [Natronosalvus caseinilyticus]|uniref:CPBP family intramembrane glutamic endopeptidase n=1 Tax=Natronosalvus caseinilyticus TaxID=2953747 RepID=UPI0028A7CBAA|nr:type II CAAX endopeptidase family protein [Natronosalvus caseinilyticus]